MIKALVPVDGSNGALCAVRYVINLIQGREPLDVHLLNVQPPLHGDVTAFIRQEVVRDFHIEEGRKAMQAACALLDDAGVRYTKHFCVGRAATVIAECAQELRCDRVIMGTHGFGTIAQLLLGSVSHEAIHQMDPRIPVTLVKAGYRDAA